jgi:nucleoside triphosphate diphosphatase
MKSDPAPASQPRPLQSLPAIGEPRLDAVSRLIAIIDRLRAPDGCPWDREQTLTTVSPHLVEEAHELLEAIETAREREIVEEAGDLLMGLILLARIAEQERRFDLAQIAEAVSEKLVRRHPHVFGDVKAGSADEALRNWEQIKQAERAKKQTDASALAGVPVALPALQRAQRLANKAMSAGFRWTEARAALAKIREELGELEEAYEQSQGAAQGTAGAEPAARRIEEELGDVFVAAAIFANYVRLDPERATREALRRFERRFRAMEQALGRPLQQCSLEEMLAAWRAAAADVTPVTPASSRGPDFDPVS